METTPDVKRVTLRFPIALWEALRALAKAHRRSLVGEIIWILQAYVDQQRSTL